MAETPAGFRRACSAISRGLDVNIDLDDRENPLVTFRPIPVPMHKMSSEKTPDVISNASRIGVSVAKLAIQAKTNEYHGIPDSPAAIRQEVLERSGVVTLRSLLHWCWSKGVPVVHLSHTPGLKMDGLAVEISGETAIVTAKTDYPSKLAFIVAHELGHISLDHLKNESGFIADEHVERATNDVVEIAANQFACELLTGDPDPQFGYVDRKWPQGLVLAEDAKNAADHAETPIDPAQIVNNWCFIEVERLKANGIEKPRHVWGIGANALKALDEVPADGPPIIREVAEEYLDSDELTNDSWRLLSRLTGGRR